MFQCTLQHALAHHLCQVAGTCTVGVGQHAGKLLATAACHQIGGARDAAGQRVRHLDQALVAARVTIVVVVGLEVVDVHADQRNGCVLSCRAAPFHLQVIVKPAPVADAGEVVLRGQALQQVTAALELDVVAHTCLHDGGPDGLDDVVDGPHRQAPRFVFFLVARRDKQHRNARRGRVALEAGADFVAVHAGHHHIEQDQVRGLGRRGQRKRTFAVDGHPHLVMLFQNGRHHLQVFR